MWRTKLDSRFWLHICRFYVLYAHQWWSLWILAMLSVVHLSPTALSHTQQHCRHAQLGRRPLQGRIRLHKLYSIFLQPASLYASTITSNRICFNCSHSCEIPCIPMFYGCLLLQSLTISLFASFSFWYPSPHLCVFSVFAFCSVWWSHVLFLDVIMEIVCSLWCVSDNALLLHNLDRLSALVLFLSFQKQISEW